jgi:hypothetical protein
MRDVSGLFGGRDRLEGAELAALCAVEAAGRRYGGVLAEWMNYLQKRDMYSVYHSPLRAIR